MLLRGGAAVNLIPPGVPHAALRRAVIHLSGVTTSASVAEGLLCWGADPTHRDVDDNTGFSMAVPGSLTALCLSSCWNRLAWIDLFQGHIEVQHLPALVRLCKSKLGPRLVLKEETDAWLVHINLFMPERIISAEHPSSMLKKIHVCVRTCRAAKPLEKTCAACAAKFHSNACSARTLTDICNRSHIEAWRSAVAVSTKAANIPSLLSFMLVHCQDRAGKIDINMVNSFVREKGYEALTVGCSLEKVGQSYCFECSNLGKDKSKKGGWLL